MFATHGALVSEGLWGSPVFHSWVISEQRTDGIGGTNETQKTPEIEVAWTAQVPKNFQKVSKNIRIPIGFGMGPESIVYVIHKEKE